MKTFQRRDQCWLKENLVWENQTIVKSTPTTEPQKSKSLRAAAHQLSKQYCCWNVEMHDQLPRRDIDKDNKQQLFQFIRENQSGILLILDGLGELSSSKFTIFSELIEERVHPRCHKPATERHEAWKEVRKCYWHAASDRRIHWKPCKRICHQVL